jgi:diamine N-acetyltransferase
MIYGNRIRLRSIERSDLERFVQWMNDPDVIDGLSLYLPLSTIEEERWFERVLERPQAERPLMIEARMADDNWLPIGTTGYFDFDWRVRSAELGISIGDKSQWDQGFGTEALSLWLKHGFETLNLNRIYLRVFDFNQRAIRVYEKIGFVHEGRQREGMYKHGRYVDVLMMSVLRSEWEGMKG